MYRRVEPTSTLGTCGWSPSDARSAPGKMNRSKDPNSSLQYPFRFLSSSSFYNVQIHDPLSSDILHCLHCSTNEAMIHERSLLHASDVIAAKAPPAFSRVIL